MQWPETNMVCKMRKDRFEELRLYRQVLTIDVVLKERLNSFFEPPKANEIFLLEAPLMMQSRLILESREGRRWPMFFRFSEKEYFYETMNIGE
jgi:ribosomal protein L16 Arg81 hydroxylase